MSRASQPRVFGSEEWGGGLKLWRVSLWDRCCPFAANKSKLNTESPWGGGVKSLQHRSHVPAGLSFTDFFSGAMVFANSNTIKTIKSSAVSMRVLHTRARIRLFIFCRTPGGGVKKSARFQARTGGPAT